MCSRAQRPQPNRAPGYQRRMRNLKLALRVLLRSPSSRPWPSFPLALGIGTNTAIFSMMHELLLRPLPVQEPEQLANLSARGPKPGSQSCGMAGDCDIVFSYPMFRDLERSPGPFSGIAGHYGFGANIAYRGQSSSADALLVSVPISRCSDSGRRLGASSPRRTIARSEPISLPY